ncbi:Forkhead box protein O6 [Camelus dromedarius]|uniref:Forkhead box protein O6 n=1 Tax=Camelus dromedarius TaxID=9838 RepID=A0A5N4DDK7_CAMDR|nr:Forkhead box protein O6 [Camelus dromedarius]
MPAAAKWATSPASHASDDYEAWADFRGSGRPLLGEAAELEDDEALEALAPSSPLMYPSPASALSPALAAAYPGKGGTVAPPGPSRSALAHPSALYAAGEAGAAGLAPPAPRAVFGGPPGGLLLDALPGPYAAAAAGPLGAAPDRFPADLDLDMFSGSLECDVESIILNDFMDSDEMDFNFDSALPPPPPGLAGAPPPNQSWVPG